MKFRIFVISMAVLFLPQVSAACSCAPFDAEKNFNKAHFVFEGHVTRSEAIEVSGDVGPWSGDREELVAAKFKVLKTWKGDPTKLEGVITHTQSSACGVQLAAGQDYLFFVYDTWNKKGLLSSSQYGVVTYCGGPNDASNEQYKSTLEWLERKNENGT